MSSYVASEPPRPTDAELEILTVLWSIGPATVRAVHDVISGRRPAQYSTILKFMQVMAERGWYAATKSSAGTFTEPRGRANGRSDSSPGT
jgi:predicted transcriptional regulator